MTRAVCTQDSYDKPFRGNFVSTCASWIATLEQQSLFVWRLAFGSAVEAELVQQVLLDDAKLHRWLQWGCGLSSNMVAVQVTGGVNVLSATSGQPVAKLQHISELRCACWNASGSSLMTLFCDGQVILCRGLPADASISSLTVDMTTGLSVSHPHGLTMELDASESLLLCCNFIILYIYAVASGQLICLHAPARDTRLADAVFSPTGGQLAVLMNAWTEAALEEGRAGLFLYNTETWQSKLVKLRREQLPDVIRWRPMQWSPNSLVNSIVYVAKDGQIQVYQVNDDTLLTLDFRSTRCGLSCPVSWSHDGYALAVLVEANSNLVDGRKLYAISIVDVVGLGAVWHHPLPPPGAPANMLLEAPATIAWSQDDSCLIVMPAASTPSLKRRNQCVAPGDPIDEPDLGAIIMCFDSRGDQGSHLAMASRQPQTALSLLDINIVRMVVCEHVAKDQLPEDDA